MQWQLGKYNVYPELNKMVIESTSEGLEGKFMLQNVAMDVY
jgi:hypothetical protein